MMISVRCQVCSHLDIHFVCGHDTYNTDMVLILYLLMFLSEFTYSDRFSSMYRNWYDKLEQCEPHMAYNKHADQSTTKQQVKKYVPVVGHLASGIKPEDMNKSGNTIIIDWMSTSCTFKFKIMEGESLNDLVTIHLDMLIGRYYNNLRKRLLSISDPIDIVKGLDAWKNDFSCNTSIIPGRIMTEPCGYIQYSYKYRRNSPSKTYFWSKTWYIHVHNSLILNATIVEADVSYSERCSSRYIAVYEGLEVCKLCLIDIFCGILKHESVYTKKNKATILVSQSNYRIALKLKYTSLFPGWAYKNMNVCVPNNISSNVPPSFYLYVHERQFYFWYLSNELLVVNKTYQKVVNWQHISQLKYEEYENYKKSDLKVMNYSYQAILRYNYINIPHFECDNKEAAMFVYPALLPSYWVRWRTQPHTVVHCNGGSSHPISLDFHIFSTLVLQMQPFASVNLNFHIEINHQIIDTMVGLNELVKVKRNGASLINNSSQLQIDVVYNRTFLVKYFKQKIEGSTVRNNLVLPGLRRKDAFYSLRKKFDSMQRIWIILDIVGRTHQGKFFFIARQD